MQILITGGAGFIGSNLSRFLSREQGVSDIRVLDDLSTGYRRNLTGVDVRFIEGSILDRECLSAATKGVDAVVHLGAIPSVPRSVIDPRASHEANATGTLNVLEAAREQDVAHVIVASSSSVYGANPHLPKNERDWTRPMSPYAVSKQATEGYALAYHFSYGIAALALRFFNVYGPCQSVGHAYAAVIPQFIDAALHDRPVRVHGDGTQSRDFTFVETVCAVIHDALLRKVHSDDPVNLAYGTRTSLLDLLDELERQLDKPIDRLFEEARVGDVKASQADPRQTRTIFPSVEPVQLREGLKSTVEWYKAQEA